VLLERRFTILWTLLYTRSRTGVNLKSRNVIILCCEYTSLAKTKALHVLHRSIIRLVLVGLSVAIELQKRQCTARSHELIIDKLLLYDMFYLSYI
jgi:hypothetical protein